MCEWVMAVLESALSGHWFEWRCIEYVPLYMYIPFLTLFITQVRLVAYHNKHRVLTHGGPRGGCSHGRCVIRFSTGGHDVVDFCKAT